MPSHNDLNVCEPRAMAAFSMPHTEPEGKSTKPKLLIIDALFRMLKVSFFS